MKKDKKITPVIFFKELEENEVFAFFPNERFYGIQDIRYHNTFMSYAHIGQHSPCLYEYVKDRTKCEPCESIEDFESLKNELEGLGYNLKIRNCIQA